MLRPLRSRWRAHAALRQVSARRLRIPRFLSEGGKIFAARKQSKTFGGSSEQAHHHVVFGASWGAILPSTFTPLRMQACTSAIDFRRCRRPKASVRTPWRTWVWCAVGTDSGQQGPTLAGMGASGFSAVVASLQGASTRPLSVVAATTPPMSRKYASNNPEMPSSSGCAIAPWRRCQNYVCPGGSLSPPLGGTPAFQRESPRTQWEMVVLDWAGHPSP